LRETEGDAVVANSEAPPDGFLVSLRRSFGFQAPLACLVGAQGTARRGVESSNGLPDAYLRLRFGLWHEHLPLDALPLEGWVELHIAPEEILQAEVFS
jgi:hypothetical protein